jgi:hypothetical protein
VELLLVLPLLVALLVGMVEFSMLLVARQHLLTASREGARVAALGGDQDEVAHAVYRYLGEGRLADAEVVAVLDDEAGRPIPSGEAVEVRVRLPANHAVPDLLRFVGISIAKDEIVARTVMRKE